MFSDIQEHIPNSLHEAVRDPCSSQLHSENVIENSLLFVIIIALFVLTSANGEIEKIFFAI